MFNVVVKKLNKVMQEHKKSRFIDAACTKNFTTNFLGGKKK